jgi:DNA replication and repair protein RecF
VCSSDLATVSFGDGLNVVVGDNATGKTNLLEGAWYALRGSSPRTRREDKLMTWGENFSRVELELDGQGRWQNLWLSGPVRRLGVVTPDPSLFMGLRR